MRTSLIRWGLVGVCLALGPAGAARAADAPAAGKAAPTAGETTYAAALAALEKQAATLKMLESQGLHESTLAAEGPAEEVARIAKSIVRLAMQKESGFPPLRVRDLNIAVRELGERAERARASAAAANPDELSVAIGEIANSVEGIRRLALDAPEEALSNTRGWSVEIITTPASIRPGEEAALQWIVRTEAGEQHETFDDLGGQRMWLLVASRDLAHLELDSPALRPNHRFTLPLTFPAPGDYALFQLVRPTGQGERVIAARVRVPGAPPAGVDLVADATSVKDLEGGLAVTIADPSVAVEGAPCELVFIVSKDGAPCATLEGLRGQDDAVGPVAVVAAISAGATSCVFGQGRARPDLGPGMVGVPLTFERPGLHKLLLRVQESWRQRDVAFTIDVKPKD